MKLTSLIIAALFAPLLLVFSYGALADDFDPECWEPDLKIETPCESEGWCKR